MCSLVMSLCSSDLPVTSLITITVCEITFVVQGDTLSEGCMEMCRFVRTMYLNYVRTYLLIVSQQPLLKFIRTSFLYNFKIALTNSVFI